MSRLFENNQKDDSFFVEWNNQGNCIICRESIDVLKEYNIKQHNETKHKIKF